MGFVTCWIPAAGDARELPNKSQVDFQFSNADFRSMFKLATDPHGHTQTIMQFIYLNILKICVHLRSSAAQKGNSYTIKLYFHKPKTDFTLTLHKIDSYAVIDMLQQLQLLGRCWMLVARCLIPCIPSGVESINIEYPACRAVALKERRLETSIEDQPMTTRLSVETVSI